MASRVRCVLSLHLKPRNVSQYTTESGNVFQTTKGPAREKCRPAVDVLVLGTVKGHHCLLIELKLGNVITRIGGKTWEL